MNSKIYDKLISLINEANINEHTLTKNEIALSNPIPDSSTTANTKINVLSIPGSGYIGDVDVFYNRIDLAELGTNLSLLSEIQFSLDNIVSELSLSRVADLDLSDIENITIPSMIVGDINNVTLTAKQNSLGWIGENNVSLLYGLSYNSVNPLHHLMNVVLPGANYL